MISRSVWKPRLCFQIAFASANLMGGIREDSLRPPAENTSHSELEGIVNFESEGGPRLFNFPSKPFFVLGDVIILLDSGEVGTGMLSQAPFVFFLLSGPLKIPLDAVSKKSKIFGFLSERFGHISIRISDMACDVGIFYPCP